MKNFTRLIKTTALIAVMAFYAFNASAATILSETFATSLGNFTTQSLVGDQVWAWSTSYAKMTGFVTSESKSYVNDDWLISPAMDFSDVTKANLTFDQVQRYGVDLENTLTLLVSDSYTGGAIDTLKWVKIPITYTDGKSWTFVTTGPLSLDAYKGKENVRIAFRYKSTSTASATWEIKNLLVESVVEAAATTVLEEDFTAFTAGTQDNPNSTDIAASLDTYTKLPGWTGLKVNQAAGVAKMGSSDVLGYIVTPSLNLSGNGGAFSVMMDLRAWSKDSTAINIYVNDVLVKKVTGISNAAAPYILSPFGPFEFTGGTTATKIKIEGLQAVKGRFFLDNLKITQGGTPAASATITSATFSVENNSNQTKNLTLKGKFVKGNLSVAVANKKGNAFSSTVSSVTELQANDTLGFAIPVKYAPTAVGNDTATVTISGGGLANPVVATVTGKSWTAVAVANLAALRAAYDANPTDLSTVYKITGEVFVNLVTTNRNNKHVQDATGGVLIDDPSGVIKSQIHVGDGIKNLTGNLAVYGKLLEIVPQVDVVASSTGNNINTTLLTIPEAKASLARYESTLIQINGLTTTSTGQFARANYNYTNGGETIVLRPTYADLPYIGIDIPAEARNIRGVLIQFSGTAQIVPRFASDLKAPADPSSLKPVSQSALVYGSNGILNVEAKQGQSIEIFDLVGKKVSSTIATEGVNTFTLGSKKVFLVKVGASVTKVIL